MGIKERILEYVDVKGISKAEFERRAGLSNGYINNMKGSVGTKKIEAITRAFPDISRIWLLTGEGDMYAGSVGDVNGNSNIINQGNIQGSVDNRQYYSDSPDVLKEKIDQLEALIREKEARIAEKDKQIAEKDKQIAGLITALTK